MLAFNTSLDAAKAVESTKNLWTAMVVLRLAEITYLVLENRRGLSCLWSSDGRKIVRGSGGDSEVDGCRPRNDCSCNRRDKVGGRGDLRLTLLLRSSSS